MRAGRDRGAASILVLAVGLGLVGAGVAGAAVGTARVGRHQARTAADLGALAGAARAIDGPAVACGRAARFVAANGGDLTGCDVDGLEIVVSVEVPVTPLPGWTGSARAAARAGPVSSAVDLDGRGSGTAHGAGGGPGSGGRLSSSRGQGDSGMRGAGEM